MHKASVPLRPIVSSIGSITYNISKYLASILSPLVGNSEHHVTSSKDFVDEISAVTVDPCETLVSFDVTSLFTCIPPGEAVECIRTVLTTDDSLAERTKLSPDQVCELLSLCSKHDLFLIPEKHI